MAKDIFDYRDYKAYVRAMISSQSKGGRGIRMALAKAMGSPVSHISQVLGGSSHFSMEQAEAVNGYFGHTEEEAGFFLLLLQLSRAGTPALKKRLQNQIQQIIEKRLVLKDRLGVKSSITSEDQTTFYSSWLYGAIHVMLSIKKFQSKEAISSYLGISLKRTAEILEFLVSIGLAVQKEPGRFEIGTSRIHLGNDSPMISKFHTNWRMQAVRSLEKENFKNDLHYSSVVTVSDSDVVKIKSILVKNIDEIKSIIRESPEEGVHCFSIDFFQL
jgi:uncharacterized protein (TIGR02147 family)